MSKVTIVLLVILAILIIACIVLYFLGKKAGCQSKSRTKGYDFNVRRTDLSDHSCKERSKSYDQWYLHNLS